MGTFKDLLQARTILVPNGIISAQFLDSLLLYLDAVVERKTIRLGANQQI